MTSQATAQAYIPFERRRDPVATPLPTTGADPLGVQGVRLSFARNRELFGQGEAAEYVYRLVSGCVRTYAVLSDGRRQISEFYLPGDVFGLEPDGEHGLTAEAIEDVVVVAMKRRWLVTLAGSDCEVAGRLWSLSLHDLQRSHAHMLLLGRKSAQERVVCFLMDMATRIPAQHDLMLPMSRQDIADYLGLTIETVSRTMTQLQDEGLIALRSCRHVALSDRSALVDIAAA